MPEKIELVVKGPGYYHSLLLYTHADGTREFVRGGPESSTDPEEGLAGTLTSAIMPFMIASDNDRLDRGHSTWYGSLQIDQGVYVQGGTDWDAEGDDHVYEVLTGQDLSSQWAAILAEADNIGNNHYAYATITQNCNTVTRHLLDAVGIHDFQTDELLPGFDFAFRDYSQLNQFEIMHRQFSYLTGWKSATYNFYTPYHCPLAIDLNNNGVEIVPLNASTALFDLNEDGYRQRTAWISANDGLLAIDRNENGMVDGMSELFGTNPRYAASDGFASLALLDSNGDGMVSDLDLDFSKLTIWRDLNQDGACQQGETSSLASHDIVSLNLQNTSGGFWLVQGSLISAYGSVNLSGGGQATMIDVWFENDPRISIKAPPTGFMGSPDLLTIPVLPSFGTVERFAVAATADPTLVDLSMEALTAARTGDVTAVRSTVARILSRWTGTPEVQTLDGASMGAEHQRVIEQFMGRPFLWAGRGESYDRSLDDQYDRLVDAYTLRFLAQVPLLQDTPDAVSRVYSAFGFDALTDIIDSDPPRAIERFVEAAGDGTLSVTSTALLAGMLFTDFGGISAANFGLVNNILGSHGVAAGDRTIWDAVMQGSRPTSSATPAGGVLQGGFGHDLLAGGAGNDDLRGYAGNDVLTGGAGNDRMFGGRGTDTYVFRAGDGMDTISEASGGDYAPDLLRISGYSASDAIVREVNGDVTINFVGSADSIVLLGQALGTGATIIDNVVFDDGTYWTATDLANRWLQGTPADDVLRGTEYSDNVINGGAGDDVLYGVAGSNTLIGGAGDDVLNGGYGSDVFVFGLGDGHDAIVDTESQQGWRVSQDVVRFGAGILPSDLAFRQATNMLDLIVTVGSSDSITIRNALVPDSQGTSRSMMSRFEFSDGSTMNREAILDLSRRGSSADDHIRGSSRNDSLDGAGGADVLYGGTGSDTLTGGAGADVFRYDAIADSPTYAGDAILDFESGTDRLDFSRIWSPAGLFLSNDGIADTVGEIVQTHVFAQDGSETTVIGLKLYYWNNGPDLVLNLAGHVDLTAADLILS